MLLAVGEKRWSITRIKTSFSTIQRGHCCVVGVIISNKLTTEDNGRSGEGTARVWPEALLWPH